VSVVEGYARTDGLAGEGSSDVTTSEMAVFYLGSNLLLSSSRLLWKDTDWKLISDFVKAINKTNKCQIPKTITESGI